jgi:putative transposase
LDIGPSEAETFWTAFLRKLARRGLRSVKLVVSDAHEGIKAAVAKVLNGTWRRCRVHVMRNVLAHAGRQGRRVVFIATPLARTTPKAPELIGARSPTNCDPSCPSSLPFWTRQKPTCSPNMTFPAQHRVSTSASSPTKTPLFPFEQNDEWAVQRGRYMTLETIARLSMIPPSAFRQSADQPGHCR